MVTTVMRAATIAALLVSLSGGLFAGDEAERDRKARVALALAGKKDTSCDRDARVARAIAECKPAPVVAKAPEPAPAPKAVPSCPCCDDCKCGGACGCCGVSKAGAKGDQLAKIRNSLVRVRRGNASGSGTVVWSDGGRSVILTAAHVVDAGSGATEIRGNGRWYPATVLAKDVAGDVAAILTDADQPAVRVAETDPATGTEVVMIGCTSLWSRSKLKGGTNLSGGEFYLIAGDADQFCAWGDSGGGLFAGDQLVGVLCGHVSGQGETPSTYCAKAGPVRRLLARILKRDGNKTSLIAPVPETVTNQRPTAPGYAPPVYSFPSCPSGGCPNGQCPAPTYPYRRGIFR